jgi:hypothetical protein
MKFALALLLAVSLTGAPSGADVKSELVRRSARWRRW